MKCPLCSIKMPKIPYEDVWLLRCSKCMGTLVKKDRLTLIQNRRDKTEDQLLDEVASAAPDTTEKIRCSNCLSKMEKKPVSMGSSSFWIDRCQKCQLIWLDRGELAKMQAVYEFSNKGAEAQSFRQRHANMTHDEKAAYEKNLSKLPDNDNTGEIASELTMELALRLALGALRGLL